MSKSIRLSKKHEANATMGVCFYCNKPTGTIAMLGALKGDAEAPRYSVLDYVPCDNCKELFNTGIPLIEASTRDVYRTQMPLTKSPEGEESYPTGRYMVVTEEFGKSLFGDTAQLGKPLALDVEVYEAINSKFEELKQQEDILNASSEI